MKTDVHGSEVFIDYIHSKLHSGELYGIFNEITLGSSATKEYLIITPNNDDIFHLIFQFQHSSSMTAKLFEDCTVSSNGSILTEFNQDRNRNDLDGKSGLLVYGVPTVTTNGTQIQSHRSLGSYEGGTTSGIYINLKKNSKYRLLITSEAASNDIVFKSFYYVD